MTTFRVWAPAAGAVLVALGQRHVPMDRAGGGWWVAHVPDAEGGYAFVLDGGTPLPDPRSPWQPHGVHGASHTVDFSRFAWTDEGWQPPALASGVIYELHVGTFTPAGTFDAAIARLGHLAALGVTHVELMPVAAFPGARGWGYDGVDLFAPHQAYGGPAGLARFVDACHARGLAVLLDVVHNHLGPSGSYLARFGPYFTDRYHTPWGEALNLDGPESDEVRRFLCDSALMWLERYHLDGLRIDAVHAIVDTSAVHLLEQLATEVRALSERVGRTLVLVAESDLNDPRVIRTAAQGGYGLDAQWNEDFHHALHALLTGERVGYYGDFGSIADVAAALTRGLAYDGRYSRFRRRRHGRPATGIAGTRFVGFLQNHDEVGNRPRGDRSSQLMGIDALRVAAALVCTAPFVPLLFQGEEWGAATPFQYFTDHEPELARAVREGRRRELAAFGWNPAESPDPQDPATFERSRLDWSEPAREPHAGILEWYRQLIRLRRELPDLGDPRLERVRVRHDEVARWLVMERGEVLVACNLAAHAQRVPAAAGNRRLVLGSRGGIALHGDAVELPGHSVAIAAPPR